jgi:hypothetical protein
VGVGVGVEGVEEEKGGKKRSIIGCVPEWLKTLREIGMQVP